MILMSGGPPVETNLGAGGPLELVKREQRNLPKMVYGRVALSVELEQPVEERNPIPLVKVAQLFDQQLHREYQGKRENQARAKPIPWYNFSGI